MLKEYKNLKISSSFVLRFALVYRKFYSIYKTMLSYCLKCRKNTESKNLKVVKTKNRRIMLLSKCAVCDSKSSKFIKEQEASRLLSSLGIKAHSSKIPVVGPLLF